MGSYRHLTSAERGLSTDGRRGVVAALAAAAGGGRARSGACRLRDRSAGRRLDARADRRSAEARCGARPALRLDLDDPPRGIWAWIFRPGQTPAQLWRQRRTSKDRIADTADVAERAESANAGAQAGHWLADLVICKRARAVLLLHERKTRLTLMARLPPGPADPVPCRDRMKGLLAFHGHSGSGCWTQADLTGEPLVATRSYTKSEDMIL